MSSQKALNLSVRRSLVSTPSTTKGGGGGGGGVDPMTSETVDSTTFNFGRISIRGKKLVELMI